MKKKDNVNDNDVNNDNSNLIFIASEGSYGDSDGSITVFNNNEKIQTNHKSKKPN